LQLTLAHFLIDKSAPRIPTGPKVMQHLGAQFYQEN